MSSGHAAHLYELVVKWPTVIDFTRPALANTALTWDVWIDRFDDMSSASDWTPGAQVRSYLTQPVLKSRFAEVDSSINLSTYLSMTITNMKNKLTDLWGNWLLQNDIENTLSEIPQTAAERRQGAF